jgi:hypothetical protein
VLAELLDRSGDSEQPDLLHATRRQHVGEHGPAARERAGLVEDHRTDTVRGLERIGSADQHAQLGAAPGANDERCRGGKPERTGAGDDEHRHQLEQRAGDARLGTEVKPQHEGHDRDGDDDRHEHRRHAVGQPRHLRLAGLRLLHQPHDLHQHRVGADPFGAHAERPRLVERGTTDTLARPDLHRQGFAGQHRGVHARAAVQHHSVHRHLLPRPHQQHVAGLDLVERDLLHTAPGHAPRGARPQIEQPAHGLRGAGAGARLEQAPQQDEGDDHGRGVKIDVRLLPRPAHNRGHDRGNHRVQVGGECAHADQQVHVGGAAAQRDPRAAQEGPAGPELDRGGEEELDPVLRRHRDGAQPGKHAEVCEHDHRHRERSRHGEAACERAPLGRALVLGRGVGERAAYRVGAIAGLAHGLGQPPGRERALERD